MLIEVMAVDEENIKSAILTTLNAVQEAVESNRRMTVVLSKLVPHFWDEMVKAEEDTAHMSDGSKTLAEGNIQLATLLARVIAKDSR